MGEEHKTEILSKFNERFTRIENEFDKRFTRLETAILGDKDAGVESLAGRVKKNEDRLSATERRMLIFGCVLFAFATKGDVIQLIKLAL